MINKKHLEILMTSHLTGNIKPNVSGCGKDIEFIWGEFITNLATKEDVKYIDIHYIHTNIYRDIDFKGQYIERNEVIEFRLTSSTADTKEELEEWEKKTHIDKNALYIIIQVLKDLQNNEKITIQED